MPEDNSKQQLNDMRQAQAGASSGSSSGSQSVMSGGMEWIINGNASSTRTSDRITLTTQSLMVSGSAWGAQQIDLREDFDRTFIVYLGTINGTFRGGDGIAFVLQNVGTDASAALGMGLGYAGTSPSVAVEFDTYRNTDLGDPGSGLDTSHVALLKNGSVDHNSFLPPVNHTLEDGKEHTFRFQWNATTHQLMVSAVNESGETILVDYTEDFVQTVFGGNPKVWLGFTGATTYAMNTQYFYEVPTSRIDEIYGSRGNCNLGCGESTQHSPANPINTRTGGYDYFATDISIPSTAGEIFFERTYTSLGVPSYSTNLGYGWTHNHEMHLTFGEYDASSGLRRVTLKGDTANPYSFTQEAGSTVLKP
ncbi:MAG: hypothetical protein HY865_05020, partial [Chloroflexi bacterium]|nr:hypothetical protein [Chloroflexota bacterium]